MAVSRNDNPESSSLRLQIKLCQIVQNVDRNAGDLDDFGLGQLSSPRTVVDVAANGRDGSNLREGVEDLGCADIAGMKDVLRPSER